MVTDIYIHTVLGLFISINFLPCHKQDDLAGTLVEQKPRHLGRSVCFPSHPELEEKIIISFFKCLKSSDLIYLDRFVSL